MSARRSAEELKNLLLSAGLNILYKRGLRAAASHVPMTEATKALNETHGIDVKMGSIFGKNRLWSNVGEYQLDLLKAAIEDSTGGGPNDQSLDLIRRLPDYRDQPYETRIETLVELCRVAGAINGYVENGDVEHGLLEAGLGKTRSWRLWVSIWATAMNDEDAAGQLTPALRREEHRMVGSFSAVYQVMLDKLGLRVRSPYTLKDMSVLAAAITDGVAFRSAIDPEMVNTATSPRSDAEWNLLGVGLTAIALELLEDDPTSPESPKI